MATPNETRVLSRDTLQLKGKIDGVLYRLVEQVEERIKSGDTSVTTDVLVDGAAEDIIVPTAHYVRKLLRRSGIDAKGMMGDSSQ